MKKIFMIALMAVMSMGAFAQDSKFAVGANVGYAAYGDGYSPFGVGAKFQYEFVKDFRAEAAYNYWFKKNGAGLMDFDLNFHYLIGIGEGLRVYPILGANLGMTQGLPDNETIFGFNAGAGIEYFIAENLKLNLDIKFQHNKKSKDFKYDDGMGHTVSTSYDIKYSGPVFQIGFAYCF